MKTKNLFGKAVCQHCAELGIKEERMRWKKKIKEKQFEWYSQPQDDNIVKWIMNDFKELLGEKQ